MKQAKRLTTVAAALLLTATPGAHAALNAVDPGPYLAAYGFFPVWYQDTNGRALELCLSPASIAADPARGLVGGAACTLLANPGIFDPAFPICFPGQCAGVTLPPGQAYNFPDESFWFTGDASVAAGGVDITYVSALEAAFGGGDPAPDDQISFARIRVRITLPGTAPGGTYTFTHPYGVELFDVAAGGGIKAVNMTRDIGIGGPGDFTGALQGDIGPFLVDVTVPTLGPIVATNGELFVGDPNSARPVVGSPFGTNFILLEGPAGFTPVGTDLFAVMGKLFPGVLPTPLRVDRTTYGVTNTVAGPAFQTDVFATAPATGTLSFTNSAGVTTPMGADPAGRFFGQDALSTPVPLSPISVTADNPLTAVNPIGNTPVTTDSPLTDVVTITRARYSLLTGLLAIDARSSDAQVPLLALSYGTQTLTPTGVGPNQTITVSGLPIPPAQVTVTSASGGSDTEEVLVVTGP